MLIVRVEPTKGCSSYNSSHAVSHKVQNNFAVAHLEIHIALNFLGESDPHFLNIPISQVFVASRGQKMSFRKLLEEQPF